MTRLARFDSHLLDRMVLAVQLVRERLMRSTAALEAAGIPYAVVGGHAVAAWVARVDPAAVRNTPDVDLLVSRSDLARASEALRLAGFVHRPSQPIDVFIDGPDGNVRDGVHVSFFGEKVRPEHLVPAPDFEESEAGAEFRLISLNALVRMKLTSFRLKDRVHLRDMLDVGLIDASWPARFLPELGARLQELIDNPED